VHLGVVAPGLTPFGQGRRVAQLGTLVVAFHHGQLGRVQPGRGFPHPRRCDGEQQVADHGRDALALVRADELAHDTEAAGRGHAAFLWLEVTGDQPEQRGLARSVRPDQGGGGPLADAEAHVVEQRPPVRELHPHVDRRAAHSGRHVLAGRRDERVDHRKDAREYRLPQ